MTRRLRVAEGTQVTVDGKVYAAGQVLDVEPPGADGLLARGTVVVAEPAAAKRKASRPNRS